MSETSLHSIGAVEGEELEEGEARPESSASIPGPALEAINDKLDRMTAAMAVHQTELARNQSDLSQQKSELSKNPVEMTRQQFAMVQQQAEQTANSSTFMQRLDKLERSFQEVNAVGQKSNPSYGMKRPIVTVQTILSRLTHFTSRHPV